MTVLDTLNFIAFNPLQNTNPIAVRRRKLIAKIDEQIQLAVNKDYTPTQHKWVTDEDGNQRKVEVAKRVKRWWTASVDGKINLVVRYGSKPLEFAKGKNAIELGSEAEVADVLAKVREAAEHGELDALIEKRIEAFDTDSPDYKKLAYIFDLIQAWGGRMGRYPYVRGKRTGYDWKDYYDGVKNARDDKPVQAISLWLKIDGIGKSFASKHLRFWTKNTLF